MRVAIFSDVHGNLTALEAVLEDIERQHVDRVIFAGDLCLAGPRPAECLKIVRDMDIRCVFGNTEEWLLEIQPAPERLHDLQTWTVEQLGEDELGWLASLPFSHQLAPGETAVSRLQVVHANPLDVDQLIFPPEPRQEELYGHIRQTDAALELLVGGVDAAVLAFGHLHIPFVRKSSGPLLLNVSSVSLPGDGDPRAKYALLEWGGQQWRAKHRRVSYDATAEAAAFRSMQPPGWSEKVASLESLGYIPQRV